MISQYMLDPAMRPFAYSPMHFEPISATILAVAIIGGAIYGGVSAETERQGAVEEAEHDRETVELEQEIAAEEEALETGQTEERREFESENLLINRDEAFAQLAEQRRGFELAAHETKEDILVSSEQALGSTQAGAAGAGLEQGGSTDLLTGITEQTSQRASRRFDEGLLERQNMFDTASERIGTAFERGTLGVDLTYDQAIEDIQFASSSVTRRLGHDLDWIDAQIENLTSDRFKFWNVAGGVAGGASAGASIGSQGVSFYQTLR